MKNNELLSNSNSDKCITNDSNELISMILTESDTSVYVADFCTDELLYVNDTAKRVLNVSDVPYGQKCYEYLMHRDTPCPFCHKSMLSEGKSRSDVLTFPHDGHDYSIKSKISYIGNRKIHMHFINDVTELTDKEKQLRTLTDKIPTGIGVFYVYPDGRLETAYLNDGYYELLGTKRENRSNYFGFNATSVFHPDDFKKTQAKIKEVLKTNKRVDCEARVLKDDGSYMWFHICAEIYEKTQDKCTLYCAFTDINDVKQALEQQKKSHKTTQNLLKETQLSQKQIKTLLAGIRGGAAIYRMKKDGRIVADYVTDGVARVFGWNDTDEFMRYYKDDVSVNIVTEDIPILMKTIKANINNNEPISAVYRNYTKSGETVWQRVDGSRIEDAAGDDIAVWYAVHTLVSEETRNTMEDQRRFRLVIDEMNAAIFEWNMKTGEFYCTEEYHNYAIGQVNPNDILNNNGPVDVVHKDDFEILQKFLFDNKSGGDKAETLLRLKMMDGSYHWCRMLSFFYKDSNGEPTYTIGVIIDVNKEHENQFIMSQLLNNMPGGVGIFVFAEKLLCNFYSDGFAKMAGVSREVMDKKIADNTVLSSLIAPVDFKNVAPVLAEQTAKGLPLNMTYRYVYSDGSIRWLHLSAEKMGEQNGYPVYYCVFTNPTDEASLYRNITEDSVNGVAVLEKKSRVILYANSTVAQYYGVSNTSQLIGKSLKKVSSECGKVGFLSTEQIDLLKTDDFTEIHIERNNSYYAIKAKALDWNGVESYILYVYNETEDRLNSIRQQTMLSSIPGGPVIYRIKKDGRVEMDYVSDGFATIMDFSSADEMMGHAKENAMSEIPEVEGQLLMDHVMKCLKNHTPVSFYYNAYTKNRELRKIRMDANIIESHNEDSEDIAVLYAVQTLVSQDAQRALTEQQRYRDLMNALDMALLEWDRETGFYASEKYNCYALSRIDYHIMAKNIANTSAIHPDDISIINEFNKTREKNVNKASVNLRMKMIDGTYRWTELLAFYDYDENGEERRVVGILRDIDKERIEQNEKLRAALIQAKAANEAKTAFLSRVSHDMRTPLNGILGLTTLMKDIAVDPHILNDLTHLEQSGKYLLDLINDTLDVSRIESGKLELHPNVCDTRIVFNNIQALIMPSIEAKNISFELQADNMPFTYVYVDEGRLEQIAMNILGNAIKFTTNGGHIKCIAETLSVENDVVIDHFVVEDSGCGISKDFLPHLFEPFSQENAKTTNSKQGTGLGMSITKHLIELMNGEITVSSEPGIGTRFDLILRLSIATTEQVDKWHREQEGHAINYNLQGKRILLCEDHPLNTKISTRLLEKNGIIVEHAENGKIGVEMFEKSAYGYYDAILMDIRMPIMDGIDATKAIRALAHPNAKGIPIIAMTANALDEDVKRTKEAGMNAHLSKPVVPERLYSVIEEFTNEKERFLKPRILVVDDIDMNRAIIVRALQDTYEVFEADSGEAALAILEERKGMDAVVTDIQMPGMDGFEMIRRIRENRAYRHMAIIANTQYDRDGQEKELLELGANDFLYKPMSPEIVKIRVKNALHKN